MNKSFVCIVCPNGCRLCAQKNDDGTITVSGNKCKRGEKFAQTELTNPMRSLTSTVRTAFAECPVLPVRTDGEIPKSKVFEAMEQLKNIVVKERVKCEDIVVTNFCKTGVNLIATSGILNEKNRKEP